MEYLFKDLEIIKTKLKNKNIYLFLDFDGTLTPITSTPAKAKLSDNTRKLLLLLSKIERYKIAIISGRSLADIKKRVGLKNIVYVGNHGLEIGGSSKVRQYPPIPAQSKNILNKIKSKLKNKLSAIKGVLLENKSFSLSLHFRLVNKDELSKVKAIFNKTAAAYLLNRQLTVKTGKKVWEIRPYVNWDKGSAVLWLLAKQRFSLRDKYVFPIYIGDDATDEDAFRALKNRGITIVVGKTKKSLAQYYLHNPSEVKKLLRILLKT